MGATRLRSFDEYRLKVLAQAELAQIEREAEERAASLAAYNFGRSAQRVEDQRRVERVLRWGFGLLVAALLLTVIIGMLTFRPG